MDRPFVCSHPSCESSFKTSAALKKHSVFHVTEKPFVCTHHDGCLKTFYTLAHLERHIASHDKPPKDPKVPKEYKCSYCDMSYRHKFNLKVHQAVHTGDKPFKCDQCDASFALKGRLKKHSKTHFGYQCTECDFKGETWSALRKHTRCHNTKCPQCSRFFATESTLKKHLEQHEADKSFQCPQCPLTYKSSSNLRAHVKSVHERVKHTCDICQKKFSFKHTLIQHCQKKHCPQVLTDATNEKKKGVTKKGVTKKRKLLAIALSGYEKAAEEEREDLLLKDKMFRKENPSLETELAS